MEYKGSCSFIKVIEKDFIRMVSLEKNKRLVWDGDSLVKANTRDPQMVHALCVQILKEVNLTGTQSTWGTKSNRKKKPSHPGSKLGQ